MEKTLKDEARMDNRVFYFHAHFGGGGGASIGAKAAGCFLLPAIEFNQEVAEVYNKNVGNVLVRDIAEVSSLELKPYIPTKRKNGDILIMQTSPPCQDYSRSNRDADSESERAKILDKTWRHYLTFRPEYIVLENVPGYYSASPYTNFKKFLKKIGYSISFDEVICCADYGVPQTRNRLIMIATKHGYPEVSLRPTHDGKWIGWYKAIEDLLPTLRSSELTGRQFDSIARLGYERNELLEPLLIERLGQRKESTIRAGYQPAWTITAGLGSDGKKANRKSMIDTLLPDGRCLSLSTRAIARLQSFPDDYIFSGKSALDIKIIGNSVPPRLMQTICEQIKQATY